jgi:hypothetical protein
MSRRRFLILSGQTALASLFAFTSRLHADESLAGVACRSVHLGFPAEEAALFYNEITVEQSAPGTYFMVCGWSRGYFGIQDLGRGKKVVLFSVWDSAENDPNAAPDAERVRAIDAASDVRVKRFGNEGSGGQSFFDYDWKVGETYRCCVTCRIQEGRTEYTGWFFVPESKKWKKLVTFSLPKAPERLKGLYSFVEDFRRNGESAKQARIARYGNGWVYTLKNEWKPLDRARFTGDSNPAVNIDSGLREGQFFLATGGETVNNGTKLNAFTELKEPLTEPPSDMTSILEYLKASE